MKERRAGNLNTQGLVITAWAWAFAMAGGQGPDNTVRAFATASLRAQSWRGWQEGNAKDLGNTAWAFATADQMDAQLLTVFGWWLQSSGRVARRQFQHAEFHQKKAWAFAQVRQLDTLLFTVLAMVA